VDDYHFLCPGECARSGWFYTTEENDRQLDLFPISEALRYRLPFSPAQEVVGYLESLAKRMVRRRRSISTTSKNSVSGRRLITGYMKRGWLTQFIEGVLASDIIKTERYCDYHARAKTRGVVYLPTTSISR